MGIRSLVLYGCLLTGCSTVLPVQEAENVRREYKVPILKADFVKGLAAVRAGAGEIQFNDGEYGVFVPLPYNLQKSELLGLLKEIDVNGDFALTDEEILTYTRKEYEREYGKRN